MSEKLDKFDLDFNILFTILTRYNLDDLVCVDFSMVHYIPGVIGVTIDKDNYFVYEIDDKGLIVNTFESIQEEEVCIDVLSRVGILFD